MRTQNAGEICLIAKKAAHDLANEIDVTDSVRLLDQLTLWKIIREEQTRAWQLSWTRSSTGTATREIYHLRERSFLEWIKIN